MVKAAYGRAVAAAGLVLVCAGCASTKDPYTRENKVPNAVTEGALGAARGAATHALAAVVQGGDVAKSMVGGALTHGINGVMMGAAMDRLEAGLLAEFEAVGVKATPRGQNIVLEIGDGIRFDRNSAEPNAAAARKLRAVGLVLARFQRNRIDVIGHTSSEEAAALSGQRAAAVRRLLAQRGVAPGRLRTSAKGAAEPVRTDESEAARAFNRRVDVLIAPLT